MREKSKSPHLMIIDACVLINYLNVDRSILNLISRHIGEIYVASTIVDEINNIKNANELADLGLVIIEPEIEDLYTAIEYSGPLSFPDMICYLTAKRNHYICVTDDKNLRKKCESEQVPVLWGLELILGLYEKKCITKEVAESIAVAIHASNPRFITDKIVKRFKDRL